MWSFFISIVYTIRRKTRSADEDEDREGEEMRERETAERLPLSGSLWNESCAAVRVVVIYI